MDKRRIIISNLVYGSDHTEVFLNYHVKSMFDETNIPAHNTRIEKYLIFVDEPTLKVYKHIQRHAANPNIALLMAV